MAIRKIREIGDEVLTKVCKEVTKMTPRTTELIDDMLETMYEAMGVGLAAPQVGILKRIVVIDIGEGPVVMINPRIVESSGEQTGEEGCLSVPGKSGIVIRLFSEYPPAFLPRCKIRYPRKTAPYIWSFSPAHPGSL